MASVAQPATKTVRSLPRAMARWGDRLNQERLQGARLPLAGKHRQSRVGAA